ncbi:MAG: tyrosine-protein phosphatase [Verrucomicrobiae bacterium]|nr:tyrosine-protein phosphatase [Verrucomicrobiae bacterium]
MKPSLIPPFNGPEIRGLRVPHEFYWVLDHPAPLAGMSLPSPAMNSWSDFHEMGFKWVVCLCSEIPRYDPAPLKRLMTVELCDLVETELPDDPQAEEESIRLIADKVVEKVRIGEGVIVHCAGGHGRTGTVLGVALRRLGCPTEEILTFLDEVHRARQKPGWPESPWQSEVVARTCSRDDA